jgi:catechol-2,3-dioxygenase
MNESTARIKALGEVVLRVRDLDAMQEFYEKVVGLELLARYENIMAFFVHILDFNVNVNIVHKAEGLSPLRSSS